jgi:hypothetical protein
MLGIKIDENKKVFKNNKFHYYGELNQRKATCECCGKVVNRGKGYKVISGGDYDIVCSIECENILSNKKPQIATPTIIDMQYTLIIVADNEQLNYIVGNNGGYTRLKRHAKLVTPTRASLKSIKSLTEYEMIVVVINNNDTKGHCILKFKKASPSKILASVKKSAIKLGCYDYSNIE